MTFSSSSNSEFLVSSQPVVGLPVSQVSPELAQAEPMDQSSVDAVLHQGVQQAYEAMVRFGQREAFAAQMGVAFGEGFDGVAAGQFFDSLVMGTGVLPRVEVLDDSILGGALGAYAQATDTVYLSRQFLASGDFDAITGVLIEEFGHGVDARVNAIDAAGDEGDIFSRIVQDNFIDASVLVNLQNQDDQSSIFLNGKTLDIEMNSISWSHKIGAAKDIDTGADGSVWVIGMNSRGSGGNSIHKWTGFGWEEVGGAAVKIAVQPDGTPWVVNANGVIYQRQANQWIPQPGLAKDIDIGADGSVWVIGMNSRGSGGNSIHKWTGFGWEEVGGAAVNVAATANGGAWVINANGSIFQSSSTLTGGSFSPLLTRQNASYFQSRRQFYGKEGNPFAESGLGSSLLGENSSGMEGNCTWYVYGRLKELGYRPEDAVASLGQANAKQWGAFHNGASIATQPQAGDIAQWTTGEFGHVAIVEKVEGDYIWISESNWRTDKDGDQDGDGKTVGDGTLHHIVKYHKSEVNRFIRLRK